MQGMKCHWCSRRGLLTVCWVGMGLLVGGVVDASQQTTLEVLALRENVHLITGAGNNIVLQTGDDGVLVIGAGNGKATEAVLAEIRKISNKPIRYLVDTGPNAEEVGGNQAIAAAGERFGAIQTGGIFNEGAIIVAHENVMNRMSDAPSDAWPSETFFTSLKTMFLNNEGIEIRHRPAASSDGVTTVFLRRSDVIVAGELIDADRFPQIDVARGGSINGLLKALNELVWEAIPQVPLAWRDGGTLVVPARGRVYERDDVVQYRDMLTVIRDRVQALIQKGATKQQVIAANPAIGYVRRYGSDKAWDANAFVEAVYESLMEENP